MRCINNKILRMNIGMGAICALLTGCGSTPYSMAYSPDYPVSSYRIFDLEENADVAIPFATDLCVVDGTITGDAEITNSSSAALFSLSSDETLYAKNVHEKLAPASLTKVMTALVALKYGSPDEVLTASSNVKITESGAQMAGIKEGDQMTLIQALHLLLINSANDAAVMVAEGIGGSVEGFSELMNQEAKVIGATNSNFVNPHGLTADNHYVTAYDMYLIFNAALGYELFNEIISMPTYTTVYKDRNGNDKEISVNTTNLYLQGETNAPDAITVIGGKTGTTNAAGHCLILLSRDSSSKPYISVILRSEGRDTLYGDMTELLSEIKN
ncbi:D-alanyl-D-alanine carboxypeptidase family protein [Kineothrix sp. MB12-C1]|uniref:D-alanyl-D-alanine carboxypeptidase family protein n=1 Tax=Kineothrix sp. MB12-C1 TaxID=3070215 RepID=UPI0027D248F2|nr:serine hydrolase [Kineothrix sp. MB12-C1]WMC92769.1 serine hydrolase [Kineothrix sp. MB12-C1]